MTFSQLGDNLDQLGASLSQLGASFPQLFHFLASKMHPKIAQERLRQGGGTPTRENLSEPDPPTRVFLVFIEDH